MVLKQLDVDNNLIKEKLSDLEQHPLMKMSLSGQTINEVYMLIKQGKTLDEIEEMYTAVQIQNNQTQINSEISNLRQRLFSLKFKNLLSHNEEFKTMLFWLA